MTITSRVKLLFADGTKKRIQLFDRPPKLKLNLQLDDGSVMRDLYFTRVGPDTYQQDKFIGGDVK